MTRYLHPRRWLLVALALIVWGLTDVRNRGRIDPDDPLAHKTDLTVYTEAGAAFFDGRNPYDVSNPRGWRYLYPPLFAILLAPLSALDPQWQAVVWYFVSLLFALGCWGESVRIWRLVVPARASAGMAGQRGAAPSWLGALSAATLALPALNCLQRGQVGILVAYLIVLGYRLIAENRSWWGAAAGGAALAGAVTIKLTPALPALFLLGMLLAAAHARQWAAEPTRRFIRVAAGLTTGLLLFLLVVPSLAIGAAANVRHLHTWIDRVAIHHDMGDDNNSGFYSVRNQSLTNAVQRLGNWVAYAFADGPSDLPGDGADAVEPIDQPAVQRALIPARFGLLALLLIGGWKAARRGDSLDLAAMFGLATTATLLVSPLSWAHHYLLWLPGLLLVPAWLWRGERGRLAATLAIASCGLMIAHYLLLDWTGRAGLLGLGTTAWFLVAARIAAKGDLLAVDERISIRESPDGRAEPSRQAA
jgi:Glycosyltransferase family 87